MFVLCLLFFICFMYLILASNFRTCVCAAYLSFCSVCLMDNCLTLISTYFVKLILNAHTHTNTCRPSRLIVSGITNPFCPTVPHILFLSASLSSFIYLAFICLAYSFPPCVLIFLSLTPILLLTYAKIIQLTLPTFCYPF